MTTEKRKRPIYNRFTFIGNPKLLKGDIRKELANKNETWFRDSLAFLLTNDDDTQNQYIELDYGYREKGKPTFWSDGKQLPLSELSSVTVPSFMQKTLDLETDFEKKDEYMQLIYESFRQETDEERDALQEEALLLAPNRKACNHVSEMMDILELRLPDLVGKYKIKITGNVAPNFYNEKVTLRYEPNTIELVPFDTKPMFKANMNLYFGKGCVKDDNLETESKYNIQTYIDGRCSVAKEDRLFPLDASQVVLMKPTADNEEVQKMVDDRIAFFLNDVFGTADKYFKMAPFEVNIVNGVEGDDEVDLSTLSPFQAKAYESGATTKFSLGQGFSQNISELRLINFDFKMDEKTFADGAVETSVTYDNLDQYLASDAATVKKTTTSELKKEEKVEEPSKDAIEDALAGIDGLFS